MSEQAPDTTSNLEPKMTPEEKLGAHFLKDRYDLHKTPEVERTIDRFHRKTGEVIQRPEEKIHQYLERFADILDDEHGDRKIRNLNLLKKAFFKGHIIDHVPDSYLDLQRKIIRERGERASITEDLGEKERSKLLEAIQNDQKESLSHWVNYLTVDAPGSYPLWVRYWMLRSVLGMSTYNKEKHTFDERSNDTTAPFPELNQEALSCVLDYIKTIESPELAEIEVAIKQKRNQVKKANSELRKQQRLVKKAEVAGKEYPEDPHIEDALERAKAGLEEAVRAKNELLPQNPVEVGENEFAEEDKLVSDEEFQKILDTKKFSEYYAFAIEHAAANNAELFPIIEGEWRTFDQGSDPKVLVETLQGHGTGWCSAGESTAASQLQTGDFLVYYSQNNLGEAAIPRLAVRMVGDEIAEVRGVAKNQELDPYISPVLEDKMDEFGEQGEIYKKRAACMQYLTEIDNKSQAGEELSTDDLRFLYELTDDIEGFGYQEDPRIKELRVNRDVLTDLRKIYGENLLEEDLVKMIFQENNGHEFILKHLELFPESQLSVIPQLLLEAGVGYMLVQSLENFKDISTDAVCQIISAGIRLEPYDLKKFLNLDNNLIARSIAQTPEGLNQYDSILRSLKDLSWDTAVLLIRKKKKRDAISFILNNLQSFSHLSAEAADYLITNYSGFARNDQVILDNIESFDSLSDLMFTRLINTKGIKEEALFTKIDRFKGLTKETAEKILSMDMYMAESRPAILINNIACFADNQRFDVLRLALQTKNYSNKNEIYEALDKQLVLMQNVPLDIALLVEPKVLINHIDSFRPSDHMDIVEYFFQEFEVELLLDNIEKFTGVNSAKIAQRVVKGEYDYTDSIVENLKNFSNLSEDVYQELIREGSSANDNIDNEELIQQNLFRFTGLSSSIAERLIENNQKEAVLENVGSFVGLPPNLAKELITERDEMKVVDNFTSFTGLNSDIAFLLIEKGKAKDVRQNLDLFDDGERLEVEAMLLEAGS